MIKIWDLVQGTPPWFFKKLRSGWGDGSGQDEGKVENSGLSEMDRISILPKEILSMIFENLDFASLKQARLVSKRWHGEAEFHMKTKGIVSLYTEKNSCSRIDKFLSMREKTEKSGTLPDPFRDIKLDLGTALPSEQQLNKLLTSLPLVLTEFSAGLLPLRLTFPILLNASSTLKYLKLDAGIKEDEGYEQPPTHPQTLFPKLRTVVLDKSSGPHRASWTQISATVAWVVNGSMDLETFCSTLLTYDPIAAVQQVLLQIEDALHGNQELLLPGFPLEPDQEFASELLLQLDLKTVETLAISLHRFNDAAVDHLLATPFNRLRHLRLYSISSNLGAVTGIVNNTRATLKTLALLGTGSVMDLADHGFPVCSSLEALTLQHFPDEERFSESILFLSHHFPGLQGLTVLTFNTIGDSFVWGNVSPFSGLKALWIMQVSQDFDLSQSPGDEYLFLRNFPDLENLDIEPEVLIKFCTLKETGDPVCAELLEGVKHLTLGENDFGNHLDFSSVSVLKGLETISFESSEGITTLRVKDMPRLRMIRFMWDRNDLNLKELLKMARSVEMVVISNCCSLPVPVGQNSKKLLNKFFQSAPNVVCGCKKWKQSPFRRY